MSGAFGSRAGRRWREVGSERVRSASGRPGPYRLARAGACPEAGRRRPRARRRSGRRGVRGRAFAGWERSADLERLQRGDARDRTPPRCGPRPANIEFRELDAEDLDLEEASVDGVVCRWGYMLMPNPAIALGETRRVLRRGGRLAFAVWGSGDQSVDLGRGPDPRRAWPHAASIRRSRGCSCLRTRRKLRRWWRTQGSSTCRSTTCRSGMTTRRRRVCSPLERAGRHVRAGVGGRAGGRTRGDERRAPRRVRALRGHGGYEVPGLAICVLAS